ncbi:MAG: tetratricopeptide repeat protein, partial [Ardenticatenales bacterium]|nr:tetratricopeptide repeat protein [Ardenticatenales bacterium]
VALRDGSWHFPPAVEVRLPQSIHDIVLRRVGRLSKASQDALRLAAVLGQQFSFTDLMAVAEQAEDQLLESLDEALERDLIRELDTGGTLSFSHTEIQQVIYEALSPLRRRALHRRAGLALEEWHASNMDAIAGQLAYHFIQAGDREKAFAYSLQAAQRAQLLHAHQDALSWYTQALGYLTDTEAYAAKRVDLYEGLGAMLQMQARFTEAIATYTAMRSASESIGDTAAQARAWRGLSGANNSLGDHHSALECAQRAEHMARVADAKIEIAASIQGQGWAMYKMGNPEAALAFGQQALDLSRTLNARNEMALSLNLLGAVSDLLGHYDQANLYWWEALALYREMGNRTRVGVILSNLGDTARMRGDYHTSVSLLQEALSIAREMENREGEMTYMNNLGGAWVGLGEFRAAETELRQVIRMPEAARWGTLSETYCFLAEACMRQGKLNEALEAARQALELGQQRDRPEFIGAAWRVLGMVVSHFHDVLEHDEEAGNASEYFARSAEVFSDIPMDGERARTLREWAEHERHRGDAARSQEMWRESLQLFNQLGMELEVERMQSRAE